MDARFENHGSLWLVRPLTAAATDWIEDNVFDEAQFWGNALVVEPRYVEALAEGMTLDGLAINLGSSHPT